MSLIPLVKLRKWLALLVQKIKRMPINSPNIFCYDINVESTDTLQSDDVFEVIGDLVPINGSTCKDSTFVGDVFSEGLVVGYSTQKLKRDSDTAFAVTDSQGTQQVPFDRFGKYNKEFIESNIQSSFYVSSLLNQVANNKASSSGDPNLVNPDGTLSDAFRFSGNDYFESDTIDDIEQQLTIAIVFKFPDATAIAKTLLGSSTATDTEKAKIALTSGVAVVDFGSLKTSGKTYTSDDEDKFQLLIFQISGGASTDQTNVFANRSTTDLYSAGNVGTNGIGPKITIGAEIDGVSEWVGEIGEVLIWNTRFTNTYELSDLQTNICDRWGIE